MAEAAAPLPAGVAALEDVQDDEVYRVVFEGKSLGMRLKLIHGKILITNFLRDAGTKKKRAAEEGGVIRIGDRVVAVAGVELETCTFKEAVAMIMTQPRPLELSFRRGPGDYMGSILHDRPENGNIFSNMFSASNANDGKKKKQLTRVDSIRLHKSKAISANNQSDGRSLFSRDSMRVHKSNLRAKQLSNAGAGGGAGGGGASASAASPIIYTATGAASAAALPGGRVLKSCLKKPVGERDASTPKKSLKWSDQAGRNLEQVWFAERTHYSTPKQRRLGIYTPRMEDSCIVS